jgi:hypothetical protein
MAGNSSSPTCVLGDVSYPAGALQYLEQLASILKQMFVFPQRKIMAIYYFLAYI